MSAQYASAVRSTTVAGSAKAALANAEKGRFLPIYYLYGEEPFKAEEFAEKILAAAFGAKATKQELSFCLDRLDGSQSTGSDLLECVQSTGLFGGSQPGSRRVVLVRQAHQLKEIDPLFEALSADKNGTAFGENILLLLADSLDGRRKFHQWLKKQNYAFEFKRVRDAELGQWIQYLGRKSQVTIDPQAAQLLAITSEGSLYRLSQEIEKAALFAAASADAATADGHKASSIVVTAEHVKAIAGGKASFEMSELVRSIFEGKKTRSLLLTEQLIRTSDEALGLVGFLTWALRNPSRAMIPALQSMSSLRRKEIVAALVDLDLRLKSAPVETAAIVEDFVLSMT